MFEKALKLDTLKFKKTNQISTKRPSEYWLIFFKKYILGKQSLKFRLRYLFFIIPLGVLIFIIFNSLSKNNYNTETHYTMLILSLIFSIIANVIGFFRFDTNYYRDVVSFNHLARFIISIKGDILRDLIHLRLNYDGIEKKEYYITPLKLGLNSSKSKNYDAYGTERYKANMVFKDGTVCSTSLYQYTVKVKTTKRRSSGKVKTKYKHKHKFLYMLSLKLSTETYKISDEALKNHPESYDISIHKESNFNIIKIKHKEKQEEVSKEVSSLKRQQESNFTKMLDFLKNKQIITPKI